jgi:hypothetical protein
MSCARSKCERPSQSSDAAIAKGSPLFCAGQLIAQASYVFVVCNTRPKFSAWVATPNYGALEASA